MIAKFALNKEFGLAHDCTTMGTIPGELRSKNLNATYLGIKKAIFNPPKLFWFQCPISVTLYRADIYMYHVQWEKGQCSVFTQVQTYPFTQIFSHTFAYWPNQRPITSAQWESCTQREKVMPGGNWLVPFWSNVSQIRVLAMNPLEQAGGCEGHTA